MKKLLIIGDGFIGKELFNFFRLKYDCTMSCKKELDITNEENIKSYFLKNNFDFVIHAAGIKNVKLCEKNSDEAYKVNSDSVKLILKNNVNKFKFIYISTDYVFDGSRFLYCENDVCNPKTVYGKSKLLGEDYCKQYSDNYLIARTSGVYGLDCPWLNSLLKDLINNKNVFCYKNIYNSPTYSFELAEMLHFLMNTDSKGIINVCGRKRINRLELYTQVCDIFGFNKNLLLESSTEEIPKDLSLDCNFFYNLCDNVEHNDLIENIKNLSKRYENKYNKPIHKFSQDEHI